MTLDLISYKKAKDALELARQVDKRTLNISDQEYNNDSFYIVDKNGNIMVKISDDGMEIAGTGNLKDLINIYDDTFYITDANGYIIFKADANGVEGINMNSGIKSPCSGLKLITIGDSLSAHNKWQKWLVEWLGVTFDLDENINGKNGYAPMAVGGTAVSPMSTDSIYIRSLDAKYYNPDIIIVYAGQNDNYVGDTETGEIYEDALGTINDTPYTAKEIATVRPTFYAAYMGMVENLLTDNPSARIYLMTHMPVRLEVGAIATDPPWNGTVRFETEEDAQLYERVRYAKVQAIREIGEKYNLPVIDLWKDAGINHFNAHIWYGEVGGGAGQVHPNELGYKRMAEVICSKLA